MNLQIPGAQLSLWPLPLIAGLLPAVGALVALVLSSHLQLIPACNPFVEGCVSVSRAARYGLPNYLFRGMALPAAVLQGLTWITVALWLRPMAPGYQRSLGALPWLGGVAALAFIAYATFLGTEGQIYRFLRANGTVVYFGFTCIAMIIAGGAIREAALARRIRAPWRSDVVLLWLAGALVTLGVVNVIAGPLSAEITKDRIENVTEWWASLIFTLVFIAIAVLWRHNRVAARLSA